MQAHTYQQNFCKNGATPILNAACKEDPAKLGKLYGAFNLDIWDKCQHTNIDLRSLPNFVQGDVCNMTMFEDEFFGTVVLGEFLEHCKVPAAARALKEVRRVLKPDGFVVVTFPLDPRPPERQHSKHHLKVYLEGESGEDFTVWHQTVWEDDMLVKLFEETGFQEVRRSALVYSFVGALRNPNGWGMVLEKKTE